MQSLKKIVIVVLLTLPIIACGETKEEPTGVIPQGHLDGMDKARNVEDVLKNTEQKQLEDVDNIE
jgi:hypothetical protein